MTGKLKTFLSIIRYRDAFIFQAPSIIGLVLFLPKISPADGVRAFLLCLGSFLLMAYIFAFNDWADISMDYRNAQKRRHTFLDKGITPRGMLGLSISLAAASVLILALISWVHVLLALIITLFGLAYSFPVRGIKGKGIPVFSSFLHFGTTLLAFLLGSMAFAPVDGRVLLIGSYLGILITAGHLVQEVEDYAGDLRSGDRTNAVRFGRKPVFVFAFALFGLSFLFLIGLAQAGMIPNQVKYTVLLYGIYSVLAVKAYRAGLDRESVWRLRNQYRVLFAIVVLTLLVSDLLNKYV